MKAHHPIIAEWLAQNARDEAAFRSNRGPHRRRFNNVDYRKLRILSQIFYGLQRRHVLPYSSGHPDFHFRYDGVTIRCVIGPVHTRDPETQRWRTSLHFVKVDPVSSDPDLDRRWSDDAAPLEQQVREIVGTILVAARSTVRKRRLAAKATIEAELARLLTQLRELEKGKRDGVAACMDPSTLLNLVKMAERHHSAVLVRRFIRLLSSSSPDGSVVVAGRSLNAWFDWANSTIDDFDRSLKAQHTCSESLQPRSERGPSSRLLQRAVDYLVAAEVTFAPSTLSLPQSIEVRQPELYDGEVQKPPNLCAICVRLHGPKLILNLGLTAKNSAGFSEEFHGVAEHRNFVRFSLGSTTIYNSSTVCFSG